MGGGLRHDLSRRSAGKSRHAVDDPTAAERDRYQNRIPDARVSGARTLTHGACGCSNMRTDDLTRWTTTLTASYLMVTATLMATLGQSIPRRSWLIATHLVLAVALLSLRTAPSSALLCLV